MGLRTHVLQGLIPIRIQQFYLHYPLVWNKTRIAHRTSPQMPMRLSFVRWSTAAGTEEPPSCQQTARQPNNHLDDIFRQ